MEIKREYFNIRQLSEHLEVPMWTIKTAIAHLGIRYRLMGRGRQHCKVHYQDMERIEALLENKDKSNPMRS